MGVMEVAVADSELVEVVVVVVVVAAEVGHTKTLHVLAWVFYQNDGVHLGIHLRCYYHR